ncbi:hypothetical protein [Haloferula sp. A504]|uniref:hypothetical protein n=1 Tax=Haloferula sp. A504 TaxID=3373601 RepID=UPI0031C29982|nr:hypothetical protein [Verrucomicrobiaceae bacterium E54]
MSVAIAAGSSCPSDWKDHPDQEGQIFVQVATGLEHLEAAPVYVCSLAGDSQHWVAEGASAIYHPSKSGFRINLRFPPGGHKLTAKIACENNWRVTWAAFASE